MVPYVKLLQYIVETGNKGLMYYEKGERRKNLRTIEKGLRQRVFLGMKW